MVYISPEANSFFLSKDVMIQLGVIAPSFSQIGSAVCSPQVAQLNIHEVEEPSSDESSDDSTASCGCPHRCLPPGKPEQLPYHVTPENTKKMKEWLLKTGMHLQSSINVLTSYYRRWMALQFHYMLQMMQDQSNLIHQPRFHCIGRRR